MLEPEFQYAIDTYGKEQQEIAAIEEMAELQKELTKDLRGLKNREYLAEELTDVLIMMDQVKYIHNITDAEIAKKRKYKALRLSKRLGRVNG